MFIAALGVVIYLAVRPRGELVGTIDPDAHRDHVTFDAKAGDEVLFRADYTFDVNPMRSLLEADDERAADRALHHSRVDLELRDASGATQSTTCPADSGKSMTSSQTGPRHSRAGVILACRFAIAKDGVYDVTGRAVFVDVAGREQKIEVRRLRPGR